MKVHLSIPKVVIVDEDVVVTIPDGWEVVAVGRHPLAGERYFYYDTDSLQLNFVLGERAESDVEYVNANVPAHRYIIVKKKTRKVYTFTETGEVRKAFRGEYYLTDTGGVSRVVKDTTVEVYPILTRTVTEI